MFRVKDKVVCVKVDHFSRPVAHGLTEGNFYVILEIRPNQTHSGMVFYVKDDSGHTFGFSSERFISITDYRKRKLKKICSKLGM